MGSVEVWKMQGEEAHHWWDLGFKSVSDIENNPTKENQFVITMNADDTTEGRSNSVLLF
jgi:hypothetical protein